MSDEWEDYDSAFMFPGEDPCVCDHDSVIHDYSSCTEPDCDCPARWEHT